MASQAIIIITSFSPNPKPVTPTQQMKEMTFEDGNTRKSTQRPPRKHIHLYNTLTTLMIANTLIISKFYGLFESSWEQNFVGCGMHISYTSVLMLFVILESLWP